MKRAVLELVLAVLFVAAAISWNVWLSHRVTRLEVIVNGVFSGGNKVEPK